MTIAGSWQQLRTLWFRLPWGSRRSQTSLVLRLVGIACVWAAVLFTLTIVSLWWTSNLIIRDNTRRQALQSLTRFDELGTPLFLSGDPRQFERLRKQIASFPEVAFLRYLAADGTTELGRYLAHEDNARWLTPLATEAFTVPSRPGEEKPRRLSEPPGSSVLRITAPAVVRQLPNDGLLNFSMDKESQEQVRIIGYVDLGIDYRAYREHLWQNLFYGALLTLSLFSVVSLIGYLVIRHALRPLADLQIPLRRLAQGETDIVVRSSGAREIAAIGEALNTTITALKARDIELQHLANHDPLTGLFNRHSFTRALEREKAVAVLEQRSSALLFIDLDRFKEINDTLGHTAGDELLIQIGKLLRATVRSTDLVCRLGGDEFTIILGGSGEVQALRVAEQICTALRDFVFTAEGQTFHIHCSIGIALIQGDQTGASTILSQADTACHDAKMAGRNGFRLYQSETAADPTIDYDKGLRAKLATALAANDFFLVFLPIVASNDRGSGHDYEGLLRLRLGNDVLPASAFVVAAERFDLIQSIDRAVIAMALEHLRTASTTVRLTINLSGRTLLQPDLLDYLDRQLILSGVAPHRLVVEISERTILDHVTQGRIFMQALRARGCGLAIDDFGVSLNSINILNTLPVDQLKIDAAIVNGLDLPFNQAILSSMVHMARQLGMRTVAKNVLLPSERESLQTLGVDYLQGHLIGHPCDELPRG